MSRPLSLVISVLVMVAAVLVGVSSAQAATEVVVDGMHFSVDEGNQPAGAQLTSYSGGSHEVTIPQTVQVNGVDYSVRTIAARAFHHKSLTLVSLPSTIVTIEDEAFRENSLTSVSLPEGLKTLGKAAFGVNALTSIHIPSTVTSMDTGVFGINKIKTVVIPPNVTSLPSKAFISNELTSVTLPATLTAIGGEAFRLNHLTRIDIPAGMSEIEADTFTQNDFSSVTIPGTVKKIGTGAFSGNPLLTSVTIADGVEDIGTFAFAQLLTGDRDDPVIIPCNITSVDLGNTVERIRYNAFQDCKLRSLSIPDSTTAIDLEAFVRNRLTSIDLGNGVKQLGPFAFGNNLLTSVTMPASITSMGSAVFAGNATLTSVTFLGPVPTYDGSPLLNQYRDDVTKLRVDYYWRHGAAAGVAGGFTSPKWLEYPSRAIAIVDFDFNGHGEQYSPSEVPVGEKAYAPQKPTTPGWTFGGWFTDDAFATPFDFDAVVTRDLTAHAKWTQQSQQVTFDLNGHGDAVPAVDVPYGDKVAAPPAPSAAGWTFGGWFTDDSFTTPFDFDAPVTADVEVQAKWTQEARQLTFDLGGHGTAIPAADVPYGESPAVPADPTDSGWTFGGWFADDAFTTPFDFDQAVTEDMTAYARWSAKTAVTASMDGDAVPAEHRDLAVRAAVTAADDSAGVPPGTVQFTIDGLPTGDAVTLDRDGVAVATLAGIDAGAHTLGAIYLPAQIGWDASSAVAADLHVLTTTEAAATIELVPSALKVDQGGSITMSVTALDGNGQSLGDVSDLAVLTSSVRTDRINGSTITFPTASPHTITATVGDAIDQVTIQVIKAAAAADGQGGGDGDASEAQLPDTGAPSGVLLMIGLGLCVVGGLLTRAGRRSQLS